MSITNSAITGYEAELWEMADALRGNMDAAEYKHVVLGLIFLKYVSDAFEETRTQLEAERDDGADPEHPDEYRARNILWVPREARWGRLQAQARQPTIGQAVDDAMDAVEEANPALEDVLPKNHAMAMCSRPAATWAPSRPPTTATLRREDGSPQRPVARAASRGRATGRSDRGEPAHTGVLITPRNLSPVGTDTPLGL